MKKEFKEAIEDSPIIAAIKDDEGLKNVSQVKAVSFLFYMVTYAIFQTLLRP